jgi:hypothetical protein
MKQFEESYPVFRARDRLGRAAASGRTPTQRPALGPARRRWPRRRAGGLRPRRVRLDQGPFGGVPVQVGGRTTQPGLGRCLGDPGKASSTRCRALATSAIRRTCFPAGPSSLLPFSLPQELIPHPEPQAYRTRQATSAHASTLYLDCTKLCPLAACPTLRERGDCRLQAATPERP